MLHRLRSVLIRPGRELLCGQVEVDETYIGGEEAGLAGGRAKGKKALVAVAVEVTSPKGFGRCRMAVIPDGSAKTLHAFITENVAAGSTVITMDGPVTRASRRLGYTHASAQPARRQGAGRGHRQAAARRAPLSVPGQTMVCRPLIRAGCRLKAPASYPDQFRFRFKSALLTQPRPGLPARDSLPWATTRCATKELIKRPRPRSVPPGPPGSTGTRPASIGPLLLALGAALTSTAPVKWTPPSSEPPTVTAAHPRQGL